MAAFVLIAAMASCSQRARVELRGGIRVDRRQDTRIDLSGVELSVPGTWRVARLHDPLCGHRVAVPAVLIGTAGIEASCSVEPSGAEPVVTIADGGPPVGLLPFEVPEVEQVHGITLELRGAPGTDGYSEALALIPSAGVYFRVDAIAPVDQVMAVARQVASTARHDSNSSPTSSLEPLAGDFSGEWIHHGQVLTLNPDHTGAVEFRDQRETLTWTVSPDGRRVVIRVVAVSSPAYSSQVGDTSYVELLRPRLLWETPIHTAQHIPFIGLVYWCRRADLDDIAHQNPYCLE